MEEYLRLYVNRRQDDLVEWLPLCEFATNNAVLETSLLRQLRKGPPIWVS